LPTSRATRFSARAVVAKPIATLRARIARHKFVLNMDALVDALAGSCSGCLIRLAKLFGG
jgi:hypothetical protein